MLERKPHEEQTGYLTFAQNNDETDYLRLAYIQGLSIKSTQNNNSYAVIVSSGQVVPRKYLEVFDYVIRLEEDAAVHDTWKLSNEWKAWWLTPFKETFKVEADILFNTNVDHWWQICRKHHELLFGSTVRRSTNEVASSEKYRRLYRRNNLPMLYTGFCYFIYSSYTCRFFRKVKEIFENWGVFREILLNVPEDMPPDTDLVYALAVRELQIEDEVLNPNLDIPTFVHMKPSMQGLAESTPWYEQVHFSISDDLRMNIGSYGQLYPLHYQNKEFITDELIKIYEKRLGI